MAYKIKHDKDECIGCSACVSVCDDWEMEDMKAIFKGAKYNEQEKAEVDLEEIGENQEAAEVCPVNCIHIKKDGKDII